MFRLILKKKAFWLGLLGIALTLALVFKTATKPPPAPPLAKPSRNPFKQAVAAAGIVESINENRKIAPAVSGLLKKVYVTPGEKVKQGALLFELDDRNLQGEWQVQKAQYEKVSARLAKIKKIGASEAISRDEKDSVRHDLLIISATLKKLELLLDQLKVRAPVSGTVLQVNSKVGEFISTPMGAGGDYIPPILLGEGDGFQIRADIDEVNAALVKESAKAKAFIKGSGDSNPVELKFIRIEPFIIPKKSLTGDNAERVDTRVLQVIFQTTGNPSLYVGQQVDVYVEY